MVRKNRSTAVKLSQKPQKLRERFKNGGKKARTGASVSGDERDAVELDLVDDEVLRSAHRQDALPRKTHDSLPRHSDDLLLANHCTAWQAIREASREETIGRNLSPAAQRRHLSCTFLRVLTHVATKPCHRIPWNSVATPGSYKLRRRLEPFAMFTP